MQQKYSETSRLAGIANEYHRLRNFLMATLGLLFLQFLLGMWANLFAVFPSYSQPLGQGLVVGLAILQSGLPVVIIHAINGLLILAFMIVNLIFARRTKRKALSYLGIISLLSLIIAVYSGYHFVQSGWVNNIYSYSMATGFIVAMLSTFFSLLISYKYSFTLAH